MATVLSGAKSDRRMVLGIAGVVVALVVLVCLLTPAPASNNQKPTMENTETPGARASFLLLAELGYETERWDRPATELRNANAAKTTLLLIEPELPLKDTKVLQDAVRDFIGRGGHVLATGASGAKLLPGGETAESTRSEAAPGGGPAGTPPALQSTRALLNFCMTEPEGMSALARVGKAEMEDDVRWSAAGPRYRVAGRCGADAVVVEYQYGAGEAVWWASDLPLTNGGLAGHPQAGGQNAQQRADLALLLASVGAPGRTVLFDEYLHDWHASIVPESRPLPWWPIAWQLAAVGVLLLLSLGRRSGPVRLPMSYPRTSPVEFAYSMGQLYQRAGATQAVVEAAHGRLLTYLEEQCGLAREVLRRGPGVIAAVLAGRFGRDFSVLEAHLEQVRAQAGQPLGDKAALKLVQALEADQRGLEGMIRKQPVMVETSTA